MHEIDLELKLQLEGRNEEARKISDRLEEIGPDKILDANGKNTEDIWLRHCFNRGWFLLQEGDYQKGSKLLEHGRLLNVYGSPPLNTKAPIYNPEKNSIEGKSIIISLEGGYGDEIIHARFATEFKKKGASKVYIAASPELVSVFERIDGVDKVILRNQAHLVEHDFWAPGFSAGWLAGLDFDSLPSKAYITPRAETVVIWNALLPKSDKIKVGIRWAGNPKFEHQQFRRFPNKFITNLSKYEQLQLYSFQKDHNLVELPENVHDLQHLLLSWEDTIAAINEMDIMITSCTSVAHLSAALGKETWVLVPILPYHTWTKGSPHSTTTPYYDSVKLFRQKDPKKWNDTFQMLYSELEKRFGLSRIEMPDEDRVTKKLNLGCGLVKFSECLNVDKSELVKPDEVVDLDILPWKWQDDEFDHIIAKDILEHLGENSADIIKYLKEMYRISANGAIWEVMIPHWRCDTALSDPTHKRVMTIETFRLFDMKYNADSVGVNGSHSLLAFDTNIDIEVCEIDFVYTEPFKKKIEDKQITKEELHYALNHLNNVAISTKMLIQVHKPPRYNKSELTIY